MGDSFEHTCYSGVSDRTINAAPSAAVRVPAHRRKVM